jgi:hypothetical protein
MPSSSAPYCFNCNREMQCLKTGFSFQASFHAEFEAFHCDLFYCKGCKAFAHNRIGEITVSSPEQLHYKNGRFTEEFINHALEWYSDLTILDFQTR